VIAVDVSSPLLTRSQTQDVLTISDQTLRVLMQRNVDEQIRQLGKRDILIRPGLGNMSATAFDGAATAIAAGEAAAREMLPSLLKLQMNEAGYRRWRAELTERTYRPGPVQSVEVEPTKFVNPEVVKEAVSVKLGEPLDVDHLHAELGRLYATGDFDQIDYRLLPGPEGTTLDIGAHEKPWGPGYLDVGLGLRTDFDDDSAFELSAQYRRRWLNKLGGEWKSRAYIGSTRGLTTELYQPLTLDGTLFVSAGGVVQNEPLELYVDGTKLAQYRRSDRSLHVDLGSDWGRWGEARLGVRRGKVGLARATGSPDLPDGTSEDGGAEFLLTFDQLDNALYPREGSYARFNYYRALTAFGTEARYDHAQLQLKQAVRLGRWSWLLGADIDRTRDAPGYALPTAGGLFNLTGYQPEELRAAGIDRFSLRVSQDVARLAPLLGTAGFWGMALETGKLWQPFDSSLDPHHWLTSTTLFVGSDTRLGPAYFAVGVSDKGKARAYLTVNGQF